MKINGADTASYVRDEGPDKVWQTEKDRVGIYEGTTNWYYDSILHIKSSNIKNYLEIGVLDGVYLSKLAAQFPKTMFYGVDPFLPDGTARDGCLGNFIENCWDYNNIDIYIGKSTDMLPLLPKDNRFERIFVDGSHSYENVLFDFLFCYDHLLSHGGIMGFHDGGLPEVSKGMNESVRILNDRGINVKIFDIPGFHYLRKGD